MEEMIIKAVSLKIHNYQLRSLLKIYLASKRVSFVLTVKACFICSHLFYFKNKRSKRHDNRLAKQNGKRQRRKTGPRSESYHKVNFNLYLYEFIYLNGSWRFCFNLDKKFINITDFFFKLFQK